MEKARCKNMECHNGSFVACSVVLDHLISLEFEDCLCRTEALPFTIHICVWTIALN